MPKRRVATDELAAEPDGATVFTSHGDVSDVGAIDFVADAVVFYCPQY